MEKRLSERFMVDTCLHTGLHPIACGGSFSADSICSSEHLATAYLNVKLIINCSVTWDIHTSLAHLLPAILQMTLLETLFKNSECWLASSF